MEQIRVSFEVCPVVHSRIQPHNLASNWTNHTWQQGRFQNFGMFKAVAEQLKISERLVSLLASFLVFPTVANLVEAILALGELPG